MNNYDIIGEQSRLRFLHHDQTAMLRQHKCDGDERCLYLTFCGRKLCVDREDGFVTRESDGSPAGFDEIMSCYDWLCRDHTLAHRAGVWVSPMKLANNVPASPLTTNLYPLMEKRFDHYFAELQALFDSAGYLLFPVGDVACEFPVFPDFSAVFQFWRSDEEFPPRLNFLWDANTLDFLHYETVFYIAGHWLKQISAQLPDPVGNSQLKSAAK